MKPWQKGHPLAELREIAELFAEHDVGYARGAFSKLNEARAAVLLEGGGLERHRDSDSRLVLVADEGRRGGSFNDFRGRRVRIPPGVRYVRRFATRDWSTLEGVGWCAEPLVLRGWMEQTEGTAALEGLNLQLQAVKVSAAGELVGLYATPGALDPAPEAIATYDVPSYTELAVEMPRLDEAEAAALLDLEFAGHYSGYNKRRSWTALSLRGFGGPVQVEKPAEMSKGWRKKHPELLDLPCADTELRPQLPALEPLIDALPGGKQRIRLMRLRARDGELARHADVTDRESGLEDGQVARIHVPLISSTACQFGGLNAHGLEERACMLPGSAWFLDTRKPHWCCNEGEVDRLHLVVDVVSSPELRAMLGAAPAHPFERLLTGAYRAEREAPTAHAAAALDEVEPKWIVGDSVDLDAALSADDELFDLIFSCPPYFDLERYTDNPDDLSNMTWEDFLCAYRAAIAGAAARLRDDRFAVWVVGDLRDRNGNLRDLVGETVRAFRLAGLELYNDAVLVTALGSTPMRTAIPFETSRKLGRTHQNVLVFVKGSAEAATAYCGPVEFGDPNAEPGQAPPL